MKNTITLIVVLLIVLAGVYWYMNRADFNFGDQPLVVNLSEQNDSGMSGTATLTDVDGSTRVELDLVGAPVDLAQPAHIHEGSCDALGGTLYPLEFPVNGVSETVLDVSLDELLSQLTLAVNVHKSPEEANVYVACGDLMR